MIALISSYGIYDKKLRSETEIQGLDDYIKSIVDYFEKNKNFSDIILCGGYTNLASDISESESIKNILSQKFLEKNIDIKIKTENTSFNIYENLVFGVLSVRNKNPKKVLVIGDKIREFKIKIESKMIFDPVGIEIDYLFIDRKDDHKNSVFEKQSFEVLPRDLQDESFIKLREFFISTWKKNI